jgi:hypothetical protein
MKKKIKYPDEPIGKIKVMIDFLPSPEQLHLNNQQSKTKNTQKKSSVAFSNEIKRK